MKPFETPWVRRRHFGSLFNRVPVWSCFYYKDPDKLEGEAFCAFALEREFVVDPAQRIKLCISRVPVKGAVAARALPPTLFLDKLFKKNGVQQGDPIWWWVEVDA